MMAWPVLVVSISIERSEVNNFRSLKREHQKGVTTNEKDNLSLHPAISVGSKCRDDSSHGLSFQARLQDGIRGKDKPLSLREGAGTVTGFREKIQIW